MLGHALAFTQSPLAATGSCCCSTRLAATCRSAIYSKPSSGGGEDSDKYNNNNNNNNVKSSPYNNHDTLRRSFFKFGLLFNVLTMSSQISAAADESTFASLAEKAAMLSSQVENAEKEEIKQQDPTKTIYDFTLPIAGKQVPLEELVSRGSGGTHRPKAVLVVNIKQDDPIARRNIPELIALGAQFGQAGDLAVICVPSDQGYYEPDTSALIRLKLASEYGYGINPALQLTDKMNLLGNTANPFMRYLQSTSRTPAGLGRIQGNFEKFLIDGTTGKPLRRYPRKYMPRDIAEDIAALVNSQPLPPAGSNFNERWREAAVDAERDTYRFQKGLNYFDYDYFEK